MNSFSRPLLPLLFLSLGLVAPMLAGAAPAEPEPKVAGADARIRSQLEKLEYKYELDDDNDFRLVFATEGERSQIVYIRSPVETYGEHQVREIWSPAYHSPSEAFPALIANRLLEDSDSKKLGGWVKQGKYAVFVIKIAADADSQALDDALSAAIAAADEMEAELTPGQDEL